jgi:hypothetical protein
VISIRATWDGLDKAMTEIRDVVERKVPAGVVRAVNDVAFGVRREWHREAGRVFDRPVALTTNATLVAKAGASFTARGAQFRAGRDASVAEARIYLRDDAFKGTPPVKYLFPEVQGGGRNVKRFERALIAAGLMPAGMYAMPARGFPLDRHGNVPGNLITKILSALQASSDSLQNATSRSRSKRSRNKRPARYFAVARPGLGLPPGIYERVATGFGWATRGVFIYTRAPSYRPRYNVFELGQRYIDAHLPARIAAEMAKEGV